MKEVGLLTTFREVRTQMLEDLQRLVEHESLSRNKENLDTLADILADRLRLLLCQRDILIDDLHRALRDRPFFLLFQ